MIEFLQAKVYLSFILFVFLWMLSPGPGHLLMLSNGVKYGMPQSMITSLGDISVNIVQMVVATLGIGSLISAFPWSLTTLKWLGIAYLFFMAINNLWSAYKKKKNPKMIVKQHAKNSSLYMQGVIVTLTNPRAIFFFSALFPPFLILDLPIFPQLVVLGICFVMVDMFFLTSYGLLGAYGFNLLAKKKQYYIDAFSSVMLLLAIGVLIFKI